LSWTLPKARNVAKQVGKAVSKWRNEGARHGLSKNEIDRMASAFQHEDLKEALRE
jgi:serine/threonine-protein kinase HipA